MIPLKQYKARISESFELIRRDEDGKEFKFSAGCAILSQERRNERASRNRNCEIVCSRAITAVGIERKEETRLILNANLDLFYESSILQAS